MISSLFRGCLVAAIGCIFFQSAPISAQTFAVASIKPTEGQQVNSGFRRASPGALNATNVTVKFLIEYAYDVREDQISGGPGWIDTDRYEVVARPPDGDTANGSDVTRTRTQALLADRFHLVVRRGTREATILALVTAKGGPKGLKESKAARADWVSNGHHLESDGMSMADFAGKFLAGSLSRTVLDRTGISGAFDFTLDWSPDNAPASGSASAASDSQPPLQVAIQEQLGLRLEPQKGPEEYLVVESVAKPTAN